MAQISDQFVERCVLAVHEHVGAWLDSDATLRQCVAWCEDTSCRGRELPRNVELAIWTLRLVGRID